MFMINFRNFFLFKFAIIVITLAFIMIDIIWIETIKFHYLKQLTGFVLR